MSALSLDIAIVNEPSLQRGQDDNQAMIPKRRQHVIDLAEAKDVVTGPKIISKSSSIASGARSVCPTVGHCGNTPKYYVHPLL
jgi:hypothetical protein